MLSLALGPFTLSMQHLALLLALGAALLLAARLGPRGPGDAQAWVWRLFLLSLVAARAVFVVQYWPQYSGHGWQVIDLRDGGFSPFSGLAFALAAAALLLWRRPALRRGVLAGGGLGIGLWLAAGAALPWWQQGSALPASVLQQADGRTTRLAAYQGKPLVVNLWATWCPPCRREMPVLVAAQQAHPEVRFVFVNQGESLGVVANFSATTGLSLSQVLFDPDGALAAEVGAHALPTTLFYDAEGKRVGSHLGELSEASLAHALKMLKPSMP
ncbi:MULTISPECIES: TlpA disulfide reductase family protein [unclassified Pseudomonas]|uniref:TlpA family protein disulfide reductase n=1 Tax=unclassified Pseudomonas TaxID=196821 RepID=UPI000BC3A1FA|nr:MULTISPECIES: TlpA disulfide reductase family protein [unclassified Pseudomonas]PVZ13628.1 thiol-disulfide isomerase/thioredoxin [Pseudomonas sp. URIL14HWK12:I12]PVZ23934.1 thiol-disulfide isomerase/thioredoxin [Pseudomonas sp. URIL14HWK12:I10]PVZ33427.1 thiol-disulfide isomerase/thioredoxin [Pseudomonas sp. URIL14HWK12:I11]SNZ11518.1 Thiol-disulfide isomerase or thioredoxin [Pseudomonas sp. URIL14HWK12:I9]